MTLKGGGQDTEGAGAAGTPRGHQGRLAGPLPQRENNVNRPWITAAAAARPLLRRADSRGCSRAGEGEGRAGHALQADVRGQLEGAPQQVKLLDLPRLPCMDGSCYLEGPGVPLLSRTGFQEVLRGCLSFQLNEELWEETASQTRQARERERESWLGSKNDRTEADPGDHVVQRLPNASPLDHIPATGPFKIPLYTSSDREFTTLAPLNRLISAVCFLGPWSHCSRLCLLG